MNHKKVKKLITKINNLYDGIVDDNEISIIERDLFLSYIRDLYEEALQNGTTKKMEFKSAKKQNKFVKRFGPEAAPRSTSMVEEVKQFPVAEEPSISVLSTVNTTEVVLEESVEINRELEENETHIEALFNTSEVSDLSDKLNLLPVKDLTKCMGINEKIFTVNELFGGNNDEFNNMMIALDGLGSMEDAMDVLKKSVVRKYEWYTATKSKKAVKFIDLIRRRYQ